MEKSNLLVTPRKAEKGYNWDREKVLRTKETCDERAAFGHLRGAFIYDDVSIKTFFASGTPSLQLYMLVHPRSIRHNVSC